MSRPDTDEVMALLAQIEQGDNSATEQLLPVVYNELRQLAQHCLIHERPGHTLQATAVVHEAYLRLVGQTKVQWQGRSHFFAVAAKMMRRVLVDHARARNAKKRGGDGVRVTLHDEVALVGTRNTAIDFLALHESIETLESLQPRQASVVELRFFAGLTVDETAHILTISPRTVKDDWRFAKAWLRSRLAPEEPV